MNNWQWWKRDPSTGVDLGKRFIKGVQLKAKDDRVFLENFFFQDLESINDGAKQMSADKALKAILEVNDMHKNKITVGLNDMDFESFELLLPNMPEKDLKIIIERELNERVQMPVEEIVYDYYVISLGASAGEQLTIKVVFAMKNLVTKRLEVFDKAGAKVKCLDINSLALAETLKFNGYTHEDGTSICVDLGDNHTSTSLIVGTQVAFTHTFPFGLSMLDEVLKSEFDMSVEQIVKVKTMCQTANYHIIEPEVLEAVNYLVEELVSGLEDTLSFYKEKAGSRGIENIFLTGGGSKLAQFHELLQNKFDVETIYVNPFRRIELFGDDEKLKTAQYEDMAPHMSVAIGMALRGIA